MSDGAMPWRGVRCRRTYVKREDESGEGGVGGDGEGWSGDDDCGVRGRVCGAHDYLIEWECVSSRVVGAGCVAAGELRRRIVKWRVKLTGCL
jgi:hypothetical protein